MKKVTAKNLMIGDWVRFKGHEVKVKQLWRNEGGKMLIDYGAVVSTPTATPIPITEEWLKLNGFELCGITNSYLKKSAMVDIYYTCSSMDLEIDMLDGYYTSHPITYIHQLQQAYRLATGGKELKVKF